MNQNKETRGAEGNLRHVKNMHTNLVLEGALVGVLSGLVVAAYRIILQFAEESRTTIIEEAAGNPIKIGLWVVSVMAIGYIISRLLKKEPFISGSGIPQVKAELQGYIKTKWYRVLALKFVGGFLSIFAGLSLGREGPSIQLGAMSGKGISRFFHRLRTEEGFLLTCGASAGLSVAFNAPLSGVIFALEEVHRNFSAVVLVSCMAASATANFVCRYIFGLETVFQFDLAPMIPLKYYGLVVVLGIVCGLSGALYNWLLIKFKYLYTKIPKLKKHNFIFIPLTIALVLAFTCPDLIGTGEVLIERIAQPKGMVLTTIVLLYVGKLLFSTMSFASGAPGGIFFPLLVLGAYIGGGYADVCTKIWGMPSELFIAFVMLAMAGSFSAIVRAPITGIILIVEMTGSFSQVLTLSITSIVAYLVADILKSKPVYSTLLNNLIRTCDKVVIPVDEEEKELLSVRIDAYSPADGCKVKDLAIDEACLLVAVQNDLGEQIPNGQTILNAGDRVVALVGEANKSRVQNQLDVMSTYHKY